MGQIKVTEMINARGVLSWFLTGFRIDCSHCHNFGFGHVRIHVKSGRV